MAMDDSLLQSGIELDRQTRSARTEDANGTGQGHQLRADRKDYFCERDGVQRGCPGAEEKPKRDSVPAPAATGVSGGPVESRTVAVGCR